MRFARRRIDRAWLAGRRGESAGRKLRSLAADASVAHSREPAAGLRRLWRPRRRLRRLSRVRRRIFHCRAGQGRRASRPADEAAASGAGRRHQRRQVAVRYEPEIPISPRNGATAKRSCASVQTSLGPVAQRDYFAHRTGRPLTTTILTSAGTAANPLDVPGAQGSPEAAPGHREEWRRIPHRPRQTWRYRGAVRKRRCERVANHSVASGLKRRRRCFRRAAGHRRELPAGQSRTRNLVVLENPRRPHAGDRHSLVRLRPSIHGSPIVTTTDGRSDPILSRLAPTATTGSTHSGATPANCIASPPDRMLGTVKFQTLIAADGRLLSRRRGGCTPSRSKRGLPNRSPAQATGVEKPY